MISILSIEELKDRTWFEFFDLKTPHKKYIVPQGEILFTKRDNRTNQYFQWAYTIKYIKGKKYSNVSYQYSLPIMLYRSKLYTKYLMDYDKDKLLVIKRK